MHARGQLSCKATNVNFAVLKSEVGKKTSLHFALTCRCKYFGHMALLYLRDYAIVPSRIYSSRIMHITSTSQDNTHIG